MINQLFAKQPPKNLILDCLCSLGFESFEDTAMISTTTMLSSRAIDMFKNLIPTLKQYYTPGKHKLYLLYTDTIASDNIDTTDPNTIALANANGELTIKKCITITKQLVKTIGYDLISKEKMVDGSKVLYYKITTLDAKKNMKNKPMQPVIIRFD